MALDSGARRHGRAVSRIGPRPRAEGQTPAARQLQRRSRISTTQQIATDPSLSRDQRVASAPPKLRKRLTTSISRIEKALSHPGHVTGVDAGTAKFAEALAKDTHLSPRATAAWAKQEGGHGGADFNILNIDTGLNPGFNSQPEFSTAKGAAHATANFLKGKAYGASPGIRSIIPNARGKSPEQQLRVIGESGWAVPANTDRLLATAQSVGETRGKKPNPKDVRTLRRSAVPVKGTTAAPAPGSNKKPFKQAASKTVRHPAKIINPKWDPDHGDAHSETRLAKGISPVVKRWAKKFDIDVGAGYDPNGPHVSPGHDVTGTATDVYPKQDTEAGWNRLEQGIAVLAREGFEVGYDGSVPGTQNWSNHGRHNHAHIEWVGQGSSEDAIKKLAGLTGGQISKIESGAGSGAAPPSGGFSSSQISSYASATGMSVSGAKAVAKRNPELIKRKLAKIEADLGSSSTPPSTGIATLSRRHGAPVV